MSLLALVGAGGAAAYAWPRELPRGFAPGIKLGGVPLDASQALEPQIAARLEALRARRVQVVLPVGSQDSAGSVASAGSAVSVTDVVVEARLDELGLELLDAELTRRVRTVGTRGSWLKRHRERRAAALGQVDIPLHPRWDRERLAAQLAAMKERSDVAGVAARFDLAGLGAVKDGEVGAVTLPIIAGEPGAFLDVDGTAERLLAELGAQSVVAAVARLEPEVNADSLAKVEVRRLVGEFSTRFGRGGDADNRATNIETAAERLRGVVLAPGELVSFNELVGARTLANGFRPGWEIFRGEMVRGVGGGTCQVSSTLHAAAVYGGLDVVERAPHSRPSPYMPLGLDATVAWPSVDLKLKNPWPFPVVVSTVVRGNELLVQLLGAERPAEVKWHAETLAVLPFRRKVTVSPWLSEGTVVKKQKGIRGYRLRRLRELRLSSGETRVEESIDVYPATPEHFIVPAGADAESLLPPPAEGSVEAREAAAQGAGEGEGVVIASSDRFEP